MSELSMTGFEFSRPEYFWALLIIIPALIAYWLFSANQQKWTGFIDQRFLQALSGSNNTQSRRQRWLTPAVLSLLLLLILVALSGPSIKRPVPPTTSEDTLVIIMDLSLSMLAEDIKPSRFQRVKYKLEDLLSDRTTGHTALVVYSGDAHVVSPLTEDARTIKHLVKSLNPWMIPSKGSRLYRGVEEAQQLLDRYPGSNARILLFTDEISAKQFSKTKDMLKYPMFVVGVGSEEGAPIKLQDGRLLKKNNQDIVIAKFDETLPSRLAKLSGAAYNELSVSESDIRPALSFKKYQMKQQDTEDLSEILSKQDIGFALLPFLLLIALPLFRKGLFFSNAWIASLSLALVFTGSLGLPQQGEAAPDINMLNNDQNIAEAASDVPDSSTWTDIFRNQQQKAQNAYNQGDYDRAAELFEDPLRKGNAYSKAQAFEQAEHQYQQTPKLEAKYNLANIQAQQGKLDEAKESYQKALKQAQSEGRQDLIDRINRDLKVIEQQPKQQNQQSGGSGESDENSEQSSDSQDPNQSSSDQSGDGQQDNQSGENSENQEQNSGQQNSDSSSSSNESNDAQSSQDQQSQGQSESQDSSKQDQSASQNSGQDSNHEPSQESLDQQYGIGMEDDSQEQSEQNQAEQQGASQSQEALSEPETSEVFDYGQGPTEPTEYSQQELEQEKYDQLMRKIQTDPAQLLKNKFKIQHYQREQPANEEQVW